MSAPKIVVGMAGLVSLLLGAAWGFQVYSIPDPWRAYTLMVRAYLDAGLHHDSTALASGAVVEQPITWVHDAVRQRPATVAAWVGQLYAVTGFRAGETVTVALAASSVAGCSPLNSVTARLLNHSATPRLLAISSPCMRDDQPSLLPYQRLW